CTDRVHVVSLFGGQGGSVCREQTPAHLHTGLSVDSLKDSSVTGIPQHSCGGAGEGLCGEWDVNGLPFWRGSGRSGSGAALLWAVKSFVSETETKQVSKYLSVVRVTPPLCGNRLTPPHRPRDPPQATGSLHHTCSLTPDTFTATIRAGADSSLGWALKSAVMEPRGIKVCCVERSTGNETYPKLSISGLLNRESRQNTLHSKCVGQKGCFPTTILQPSNLKPPPHADTMSASSIPGCVTWFASSAGAAPGREIRVPQGANIPSGRAFCWGDFLWALMPAWNNYCCSTITGCDRWTQAGGGPPSIQIWLGDGNRFACGCLQFFTSDVAD
ncbi:hypothetical protein KUCAC02_003105, partial [Chaenocephalus aceratus]